MIGASGKSTAAVRVAMATALDRIPVDRVGVTTKRAVLAIEDAIGTIEGQLALIDWEATRVEKDAEARRVRAEQSRAEAESRAKRIAKIESGKGTKR